MTFSDFSTEAQKALEILYDYGRIEARRTFPRPHRYWLAKANGQRYAKDLAAATVVSLVEHKMVDARPHRCDQFDTIDYTISARGVEMAKQAGLTRKNTAPLLEASA